MSKKTKCEWMSLELKSPYVMASLTLVSSVTLEKHVDYYKKARDMGVGAIVLPSLNPQVRGNPKKNETIADCRTFDTGLNHRHKMGFTVLGPTVPNIVSLDYGINLALHVKNCCEDIPVLGSVANIGSDKEIIAAVQSLSKTGIDGIELNFSCPNVVTMGTDQSELTIKLLRDIRRVYKLPISLKITPYQDYSKLVNSLDGEVDGLTLSNAFIGLTPPNIDGGEYCPFDRRTEWAPSGMYGPFERLLTFKQLFDFQQIASAKGLSLACVGGIVSAREGIQAIMLGADVVQLSSAVLWNGVQTFEKFNDYLQIYLEKEHIDNLEQLKRTALPYIKNCTDVLRKPKTKIMQVNDEKCRKCQECMCCNRLCIAISQKADKTVEIDPNLCSGCQMCRQLCPNSAIEECIEVRHVMATV